MRKNNDIVTVAILYFMATCAFADTVVLKSGKRVQGEIIEKTKTAIKLNISDISVTYWIDEIERIEVEEKDDGKSAQAPKGLNQTSTSKEGHQPSKESSVEAISGSQVVTSITVDVPPDTNTKETVNTGSEAIIETTSSQPSLGAGALKTTEEATRETAVLSGQEQQLNNVSVEAGERVKSENIYYNKKHGVHITVPQGWTAIDESSAELFLKVTEGVTAGVVCVLKKDVEGDSPLIYVKSNLLTKQYTIEEYVQTLAERNKQIDEANVNLTLAENAHLVERNGKKFSRSISAFEDSQKKETYAYYHFLNGGMSYSIIGVLPTERFSDYAALLDEVASSVLFDDQHVDPKELADAQQLVLFGGQYFSQNQFDNAIPYYDAALKKVNDEKLKVQILTMLSSCYLEKGILSYIEDKNGADYQRAIQYAEEALVLDKTYWPATANIAIVYMNRGELEKSIEFFEEAKKYAQPGAPGYDQLVFHYELTKRTIGASKEGVELTEKAEGGSGAGNESAKTAAGESKTEAQQKE